MQCVRISVSVIHRTLTWTTGSLTCARDHSSACAYTRGLGTPTTSLHNILTRGGKNSHNLSCAPDGVRTQVSRSGVDALPTEPPRHIHDCETRCDKTGDVRHRGGGGESAHLPRPRHWHRSCGIIIIIIIIIIMNSPYIAQISISMNSMRVSLSIHKPTLMNRK